VAFGAAHIATPAAASIPTPAAAASCAATATAAGASGGSGSVANALCSYARCSWASALDITTTIVGGTLAAIIATRFAHVFASAAAAASSKSAAATASAGSPGISNPVTAATLAVRPTITLSILDFPLYNLWQ
jgi:hypothetical protein